MVHFINKVLYKSSIYILLQINAFHLKNVLNVLAVQKSPGPPWRSTHQDYMILQETQSETFAIKLKSNTETQSQKKLTVY